METPDLNTLITAGQLADLKEIGLRLLTQDNRCTANPMFCVQVKKRIVGFHPDYADGNTVWINMHSGEYEEVAPETEGAEEFGYQDQWETVMVAFTEQGCQEYLNLNGHNHRGEKRIYAESFFRCPEMLTIRKVLMELAKNETDAMP